MTHLKIKYFKIITCYLLFVVFSAICFYRTLEIADSIFKNTKQFEYAYNWLLPQFSFIQGPNNVLKQCSFVLMLSSIIYINPSNSYVLNVKKIIILSLSSVMIVSLTTFVLSTARFGFNFINANFNLVFHSFLSILMFLLFSLFWCILTLGIMQSINIFTRKKMFGYIGAGLLLLFEGIILYSRTEVLGKFALLSPHVLAKEIVIKQFPYWLENKWVVNSNLGFPYANTSYFQYDVQIICVTALLIFYLLITNLIPILHMKNRKLAQAYGFIGIPDENIIRQTEERIGKPIIIKEHKKHITLKVGKGFCKKKILIKK